MQCPTCQAEINKLFFTEMFKKYGSTMRSREVMNELKMSPNVFYKILSDDDFLKSINKRRKGSDLKFNTFEVCEYLLRGKTI